MPFLRSRNRGSSARQGFYFYLVLMLVALITGPLFVFLGIHHNRRDRPSLQWPKVSGKMTQCDEIYHPGIRRSSDTYSIAATYAYVVDHRRYVEHQITLWNPDLDGQTGNFASTHPVNLPVDVYYDPQNPANAVLIPGADEWGNHFYIIDGSFLFGLGILVTFLVRSAFTKYKAQIEQEKNCKYRNILS